MTFIKTLINAYLHLLSNQIIYNVILSATRTRTLYTVEKNSINVPDLHKSRH